jgi:sensor histidine kinase YesM
VTASERRGVIQTLGLALGLSLLVGLLFSLRNLTLVSFALHSAVSLLYALAIGIPASVIFDRLKPRIDRPVLRQWAIYAIVLVAIVLVASLLVGIVLVLVGLVDSSALWVVYRRGLLISFVVSIPVTIAAVTVSRLSEKLHATERDKQRALALATEARLASLESRVRPHFLFNALNSAIALIPEDPRRAEDVLERLSGLLRSSLDAPEARLVPLADELRVASDYLEIERVRFGDRLSYEFDVPDELRTFEVPAFAIQTLVENSVKYAVSPRKQGARIEVRARRDGDRIAIDITDDGPGFGADIWIPGHGLDGLRGRLDALYGTRARLIAPSTATSGAAVRIEIEGATTRNDVAIGATTRNDVAIGEGVR